MGSGSDSDEVVRSEKRRMAAEMLRGIMREGG